MSTERQRSRWEQETRFTRWLGIILGIAALLALLLIARLWQLDLESVIVGMLLGALVWQLLLQALEAIRERLQLVDLPRLLSSQGYLGITLVFLLLLALSLSGFVPIHGASQTLVLGGFALMGVYALERVRETTRPRSFVEITNSDVVLALEKGTLLLAALEDAGYRLITQCGRQGSCASCRVRVRAGAQEWAEEHYGPVLTPRQRREGWVLACQVPVESDLAIELFKPLVVRWPTVDQSGLSERAREIRALLPGFDCEECGYPTCDQYAEAIAQEKALATRCFPGGALVSQKLQEFASHSQGVGSRA